MAFDSETSPTLDGLDIPGPDASILGTSTLHVSGTRGLADRLGAALIGRVLGGLALGRITVELPGGGQVTRAGARPGPEARVRLNRWAALRRLVTGGDIGFAEGYMEGDWSSPDLTTLIELVALNGPAVEERIAGLAPVRALNKLRHGARRNSRAGSRRNISFHYDLGNEFYRLWLDPGMIYSSALYEGEDGTPQAALRGTLEEAQAAKLARIHQLLQLSGGERVLEIGCGWGTLAAHLAIRGAEVTGVTLSREQLAHARTHIADLGIAERAELRLQDYRDVEGRFDRIVSIEMIEAVGEAYWPTYFATLRERLAPGGLAVLQVITIAEDRFAGYRARPDFIQRYIFPGGMLPTKSIVAAQAQAAGLALTHRECFGASYARTLADWRDRFAGRSGELEALGFDARFRRLWNYYLAYCEAGFRSGATDVGLYVLRRPAG